MAKVKIGTEEAIKDVREQLAKGGIGLRKRKGGNGVAAKLPMRRKRKKRK